MIKKFKRAISGITAVAVISMSVPSYLSANIFDDALISINKDRTWKDGKSTNYYMGSVYVRFKNSTPPPIINVSAPEIQAGCSGINIKGMFVSILNLDQLANMLQNAGASLAWGVAVGLIYSLPGIANAFKMINAWAKKIQQILAAACQSGIAIGEQMMGTYGKDKKIADDWMLNHIPDQVSFLQAGEGGTLQALGIKGFDNNGVLTFGSGDQKMTLKDTKDTFAKLLQGGFLNNVSLLGSILTDMQKASNGKFFSAIGSKDPKDDEAMDILVLFIDSTKDVGTFRKISTATMNNFTIEELVNKTNIGDENQLNKYKIMLMAYMFIKEGAGDIHIKSILRDMISKLQNYLKDDSAENEKAAADEFTNPNKYPETPSTDTSATMEPAAQALANLIVNGDIDARFSEIKLSTANIIRMPISGSNEYHDIVLLDGGSYLSDFSKDEVVKNWKGIDVAAKCAAANILNIDVNSITLPTTTNNNKAINCSNVIYYVPEGFQKYSMIYMNTPDAEKESLKSTLENYLAYHYAEDLLNTIESAASHSKISSPEFNNILKSGKNKKGASQAPTTKSADLISMINSYSAKTNQFFSLVEQDVKKMTLKGSKDAVSRDQLDGKFRAQQLLNRQRGLSHVISH